MTTGRRMPWLRCTATGGELDPSTSWAVPNGTGGTRPPLDRELVVLNHRNEVILSFNLTANPIDGAIHATERDRVCDSLRTAAILVDTDNDHLPDAWEIDEFGHLDAVTAETVTATGMPALLAYALGQSPHAPVPTMGLHLTRIDTSYHLTYSRRLGRYPTLVWTIQRSQVMTDWLRWIDPPIPSLSTQFNGTGTERVAYTIPINQPGFDNFRLLLEIGPARATEGNE